MSNRTSYHAYTTLQLGGKALRSYCVEIKDTFYYHSIIFTDSINRTCNLFSLSLSLTFLPKQNISVNDDLMACSSVLEFIQQNPARKNKSPKFTSQKYLWCCYVNELYMHDTGTWSCEMVNYDWIPCLFRCLFIPYISFNHTEQNIVDIKVSFLICLNR